MYCNWIVNIYNCYNTNKLILIERIGLIIHVIVFLIGIVITILRKKYIWKGIYVKNNGFMPIECFLILSLIFFAIRIIYIICKLKEQYIICSILYGIGWLPGMYSYNIYYTKVIKTISQTIEKKLYAPNSKIIINFIIYQISLITFISIVSSILSGIYLNNISIYYILFCITQISIGLGILIIGIISLFYGIQQIRFIKNFNQENELYNKNIINSFFNIGLILILISVFAIPVSALWFYTSINFKQIAENNIFTIILLIIWDILCAPFAIFITYIIILIDTKKKYLNNFKKLNAKIESYY